MWCIKDRIHHLIEERFPILCNPSGYTFNRVMLYSYGNYCPLLLKECWRSFVVFGRGTMDENRRFNSSHKCYVGFGSGLGADHGERFTSISWYHCLIKTVTWYGVLATWKKPSSSVLNQQSVGRTCLSKMFM